MNNTHTHTNTPPPPPTTTTTNKKQTKTKQKEERERERKKRERKKKKKRALTGPETGLGHVLSRPLDGGLNKGRSGAAVGHFVERLVKRFHDKTELRYVKDNVVTAAE